MEMNYNKNHLFRIKVSFIMLLFAMCLTMNVFLGSSYHLNELSDKTVGIETWEITESIASSGDSDNTCFKISFFTPNKSFHENAVKNICSIPMPVDILEGIGLHFFLIIVFLLFFMTLFILLPNEQTLMNQKVRLNN